MPISWVLETTPAASGGWADVKWIPELSLFVAGGGSNPNKFMTSPDSVTWTERPKADVRNVVSLAWSGTLLVALSGSASNQCVFTSPDAINWTLESATPYGLSKAMRAVAYGDGLFVAVGGVNQAMYSSDGHSWTASAALPDTTASLSAIVYEPTLALFVAVGDVGDVRIMTSPDGNTWTGHQGFEVALERNWKSIATDGAGNLAAVCTGLTASGTLAQQVMANTGGIDGWTIIATPLAKSATAGWNGICYGGGKFVAVCSDTGNPQNRVMISPTNAGTWTEEASALDTRAWKAVTYSPTLAQYVAVSSQNSLAAAMGGTPPVPDIDVTGSGGVEIEGGVGDTPYLSFNANWITGSGGVLIGGAASLFDSGFPIGPMIIITGSGGIKIGGAADLVLSKDISGIYTLIKDKTNDTLYNRTPGGSVTSLVVKIPDPFIKSGYVGG